MSKKIQGSLAVLAMGVLLALAATYGPTANASESPVQAAPGPLVTLEEPSDHALTDADSAPMELVVVSTELLDEGASEGCITVTVDSMEGDSERWVHLWNNAKQFGCVMYVKAATAVGLVK